MTPLPLAGVDVGRVRVRPLREGRGLALVVDRRLAGGTMDDAVEELRPDELEELRDLITEELER